MNQLLEIIAGGNGSQPEGERDVCRDALSPVVLHLISQGMSSASIVAALAELTLLTVKRQRTH